MMGNTTEANEETGRSEKKSGEKKNFLKFSRAGKRGEGKKTKGGGTRKKKKGNNRTGSNLRIMPGFL